MLAGCRFGGGAGPEVPELTDVGQSDNEIDEGDSSGDNSSLDNSSNFGVSDSGSVESGSVASAGSDSSISDTGISDTGISDTGIHDSGGSSSKPPVDLPDSGNSEISGGGGCVGRPTVTVCDPTMEGGCPDLMQCVIDMMAPTAAGVCAFSTPMGEDFCFSTPMMTESCPPTFTCYWGICQELCLCDEDCSTGRCCGDPIGDKGFKLCADC